MRSMATGIAELFAPSVPPEPIIPVHGLLRASLILTLFLVTLGACLSAFLLRRISNTSTGYPTKILSLLSVFGGGVFLATCLLDLLPDALDSFRKAEEMIKSTIVHYPLVEILIAVGFLLVLTIEQVVLSVRECGRFGSVDLEHLIAEHHDHVSSNEPGIDRLSVHSDYGSETSLQTSTSAYSAVGICILVMALSLHAVFEGLSLGLVGDVNEILQIFFALLLHKTIIGFSLGVRLVQSTLTCAMILLCCSIFSAQIVIGGFGGIAILDFISQGSPLVASVVATVAQAVACGTFLYITCFEILPHELHQRELRIAKLFSLIAGFALIASLMALFPET